MNLIDYLLDHCKAQDINKEKFGILEKSLNRDKTTKEFYDEIEKRYSKNPMLPIKVVESCSKRTGVPVDYIQGRMISEAITYYILIGDADKTDQLFARGINMNVPEVSFLLAQYHTNCGGDNSQSLEFYKAIVEFPPTIPLLYDKTTENGKKEIENNKVCDSMYMAGSFYLNGIGVEEPNYQEAIRLYKMGSAQDDMKCITDLGLMYAEGLGLPERDLEGALDLLKKSSDLGDPVAKYNYGVLLFDNNIDHQDAVKYIKEAADAGVKDAQIKLKQYQSTLSYLKKNKKVIKKMVKKELNEIITNNTITNNNNNNNNNNENNKPTKEEIKKRFEEVDD